MDLKNKQDNSIKYIDLGEGLTAGYVMDCGFLIKAINGKEIFISIEVLKTLININEKQH